MSASSSFSDRIVIEDFAEPAVKLDYFGGTSGQYAGLDQFNRVVRQAWKYFGGGPTDRDAYTYGYDRANKPSSLANGYACVYDAWQRLVEVKDGAATVGRYSYDGQNRRIVRAFDSRSPGSAVGHLKRRGGRRTIELRLDRGPVRRDSADVSSVVVFGATSSTAKVSATCV